MWNDQACRDLLQAVSRVHPSLWLNQHQQIFGSMGLPSVAPVIYCHDTSQICILHAFYSAVQMQCAG